MGVQRHHPWRLLGVIFLLTVATGAYATRLKLLTGFDQLLPESRASVRELHRVGEHTAGVSTLFVVMQGGEEAALRKAGDALVPALKALGQPWVGEAEDDVRDVIQFVESRAGLYADRKDLEGLRDDVQARFDYEGGKAMDTNLDDDAPPPITA